MQERGQSHFPVGNRFWRLPKVHLSKGCGTSCSFMDAEAQRPQDPPGVINSFPRMRMGTGTVSPDLSPVTSPGMCAVGPRRALPGSAGVCPCVWSVGQRRWANPQLRSSIFQRCSSTFIAPFHPLSKAVGNVEGPRCDQHWSWHQTGCPTSWVLITTKILLLPIPHPVPRFSPTFSAQPAHLVPTSRGTCSLASSGELWANWAPGE